MSDSRKKIPPPPPPSLVKSQEIYQKRSSLEDVVITMSQKLDAGFSDLKENIFEIRNTQTKMEGEIKRIQSNEDQLKEKISEINEAIYDPDQGIYRRINESIALDKIRDEKLDKATEKIDKIDKTVTPLDQTEKNLKKIAGEDLRELQAIVKTRQVIDRMFWIMLTAILAGAGKLIWDVISNLGD